MSHLLVISCEHASSQIPHEYQPLFKNQLEVLTSHAAYDIGAKELAIRLAKQADYAQLAENSRLLVELNRSLHHSKLFSAFTQKLSAAQRQAILEQYYFPYRQKLEQILHQIIAKQQKVLHISVHSFTSELHGIKRNCDVGLLYDSRRQKEKELCRLWQKILGQQIEGLVVRMNYPYRGTADGFTTYLRGKFSQHQYLGIELEVNQRFPLEEPDNWQALQQAMSASLAQLLTHQLSGLAPFN